MTVDEQIRDAGARLAAVPVAVPEIGALVRHRRRRRSLAAGGALVMALLAAVAVGLGHDEPDRGDRVDTAADTSEARTPAPGTTIGLAHGMGVWPDDSRRFATATDLGTAFANEVLGWDDAEVVVDSADPGSPTGLTISHGPGRPLRAVAAPLGGAWTFMQVGHGSGSGMSAQVGAPDTRMMIPTGPSGTVEVRWWAWLGGREVTGTEPGPTGELVLPGPLEQLGAVVVMYVDDQGTALDLYGGSFDTPDGASAPPSTPATSPAG